MSKKAGWPSTGPFQEAIDSIEQFGSNLYVSHLYQETIEELLEAQKELEASEKTEDKELDDLEKRVFFLESIVSLASENFSYMKNESGSAGASYYD
mgnify:FL=1